MTFAILPCASAEAAAIAEMQSLLSDDIDRLERVRAVVRNLVSGTAWHSKGIDLLHNRLAELADDLALATTWVRDESETFASLALPWHDGGAATR